MSRSIFQDVIDQSNLTVEGQYGQSPSQRPPIIQLGPKIASVLACSCRRTSWLQAFDLFYYTIGRYSILGSKSHLT